MSLHKINSFLMIIGIFCLSSVVSSLVLAEPATRFTYENKAMGVKLTGPEGWFIIQCKILQKGAAETIEYSSPLKSIKENTEKLSVLVLFVKYPLDSPRFSPQITLSARMIDQEESEVFKAAIDIANDKLNARKNSKDFIMVIKEPAKVMFGSREGANYIYEAIALIEAREIRMRFSKYQIIKEKILYTLTFMDEPENFDSNLAAFESSLNTFVIE